MALGKFDDNLLTLLNMCSWNIQTDFTDNVYDSNCDQLTDTCACNCKYQTNVQGYVQS